MPPLQKHHEVCPLVHTVLGKNAGALTSEAPSTLGTERVLGQDDAVVYNYLLALQHEAQRLREAIQTQARMAADPSGAAELLCRSTVAPARTNFCTIERWP